MFYVLSVLTCVFVCIMCFGVYYYYVTWAKSPEIKLDYDDDDTAEMMTQPG